MAEVHTQDQRRSLGPNRYVCKDDDSPIAYSTLIGCAVTVWALYNAAKNIRRGGDSNTTNRFFRYRLYAQSFTIVAMLGSSFYFNADRFKRAEYRRLKKEQDEQDKKEKWIRELEIRDAEETEWRDRLGVIRNMEREAEAMRKAEEQKARDRALQEQAAGINDDNRSIIEQIRLKNNAERAEKSRKAAEQRERFSEPSEDISRQPQGDPTEASTSEADSFEEQSEPFRPTLGESERGGLFGIGHLKAYYRHLTEDKGDRKKKS